MVKFRGIPSFEIFSAPLAQFFCHVETAVEASRLLADVAHGTAMNTCISLANAAFGFMLAVKDSITTGTTKAVWRRLFRSFHCVFANF